MQDRECEPIAMDSRDGRSSLSKLFPQKKKRKDHKIVSEVGGISHSKRPYPSLIENKEKKAKNSDTSHSAGVDFSSSVSSASLGSSVSQPPALVSASGFDLHDEHDDLEETLRQFDMDMRYGPCIGMSRIQRWERAHKMGIHPPIQVREILERLSGAPACLWEGRV